MKTPQQALETKITLNLTMAEITEIMNNMNYVGSSLLDQINAVDNGTLEMDNDRLRSIKALECNCRVVMAKIRAQIPDDVAKPLGIKKGVK